MSLRIQDALSLRQRGLLTEARGMCLRMLEERPGDVDACNLLAELCKSDGDLAQAIHYLEEVTRALPGDAAARRRLADAWLAAGNAAKAIESLRAAIALEPASARAHNNLGLALAQQRDFAAALEAYRRALTLDSNYAIAHHNLGNLLAETGAIGEALASQQKATTLNPSLAVAWHAAARHLYQLGRYEEAASSCGNALRTSPDDATVLLTRALALRQLSQREEALACCDRALGHGPAEIQTLYVRAAILAELGRREAAIEAFRKLLDAKPDHWAARMHFVMAHLPVIPETLGEIAESRKEFAAALQDLDLRLRSSTPPNPWAIVAASQPYFLAYQEEDNRELRSAHGQLCARLMSGGWAEFPFRPAARRRQGVPRRIGVVSGQVHEHSVFRAITKGWLRALDRRHFSIHVFYLGTVVDGETQTVRQCVDQFEMGSRSPQEWASQIASQDLDLLIYPEVGIHPTTLTLASLRLAPLQAVAWGHPETSGLPTMDYYLSSELYERPDSASDYSEQLVNLPNIGSFLEPNADLQSGSAEPSHSDSGPIFLCPGTPFKYSPQHDQVLVELARRLGRCQFLIFRYHDATMSEALLERLAARFAEAGLDFSRYVQVQPWMTPTQFSRVMQRADVMLDTIGFSGFNTMILAMEAALPVVTVRGRFMRGRFGAGILQRMDMTEYVAESSSQYVEIAHTLARDRALRGQVSAQIRVRRSILFRDQEVIDGLQRFLLDVVG